MIVQFRHSPKEVHHNYTSIEVPVQIQSKTSMALVVYQGPSESLLPVSSGIGINSDSTNDNSSRFVGLVSF